MDTDHKLSINRQTIIDEITKRRGLSISTIVSHIEKIFATDSQLDISYLKPSNERLEIITGAFKKTGGILLAPVREILGEDYSYEELRLARIFLK